MKHYMQDKIQHPELGHGTCSETVGREQNFCKNTVKKTKTTRKKFCGHICVLYANLLFNFSCLFLPISYLRI